MHFQVSTPQSMGAYIAKQESRKASKRKSAHALDPEPCSKKQKFLHGSLPPAPAPAQPQAHAIAFSRPTEEAQKLIDASLPPAQAQVHDMTDLGPAGAATKKRKSDDRSVDPVHVYGMANHGLFPPKSASEPDHGSLLSAPAQVHDIADLEPATKKHKLSYANLPPGRVRKRRLSPEESARALLAMRRKQLESWCRIYKFDWQLLSGLPKETLVNPDFDVHTYVTTGGSRMEFFPYRAPELGVRPVDDLSAKVNSTSRSPVCCSSNSEEEYSTRSASLNQSASALSVQGIADNATATSSSQNNSDGDAGHDAVAGKPDQIAPSSPHPIWGDNTSHASSSRTPSVGPARNQGGRPRGRKAPAPKKYKTTKGPARFQKNHPVKTAVNVDVWENILLFCPPDFLLKARTVSPTFRSVLRDDSPIWKISRVKHFGSEMPDPPSGLSEPQYADLLTGTGCQNRGCESMKTRKTYWAFQKRLCSECFKQAFLPPRALRRVFKELETSELPQYRTIARYYRSMEEFLPGMKFDRWDNYQWLGDYDPKPSWGQFYRSGQYVAFPATAYANFSTELAHLVGNEYDAEKGRFSSNKPLPGKTCPPQEEIDAWFDMKRVANDTLVPELQAVEDWCESYKRSIQKAGKDLRKQRESFYEEQAERAGLSKPDLHGCDSYKAAVAISKPATMQSWKILQPKVLVESKTNAERRAREREAQIKAQREAQRRTERKVESYPKSEDDESLAESDLEKEMETEWTLEKWNATGPVIPYSFGVDIQQQE